MFRIDEIFKSEETKHRLTLFKTEYIKWLEIQLFEKNGKPYLSKRVEPCSNTKSKFLEVLNFKHFYEHYTFDPVDEFSRNKRVKDSVMVAVVFRVDTVDTSAN